MSDGSIKVPTWALPMVIGCLTIAVSWGVLQANTAHASDDRERIEAIAEEAVKKAQANGNGGASSGGTRISKQAAQDALIAAIQDKGGEVDEDIISKLTGKAAQYFTGLLSD